ncbi:MAG: 6-phosphofructokinase [Eubacteriales bacterium]|nr:6-phosphofructokinase [Eubacteriales bacterium]
MMGNVVIGQSGGPTAVINASLAGVVQAARIKGVEKIYGMHYGIQGFLKEDLIDLGNDYIRTREDIEFLKRTPSAFLGSCRYKLPPFEKDPEVYEKVFAIMEKYDISCFLYIGGNDSMDTVKMLSDYAALHKKPQRFIGIPKTIDNDLPVMDHTPGYGSASKYIATSVKEIIRDNECYDSPIPSVVIIEIMGRHAGWLTAAAALSRGDDCSGPDIICLPEVPFDMDAFYARIHELAKVKHSIVIAVSEGIRFADGTFVCEMEEENVKLDAFGHKMLSGCGELLANKLMQESNYKVRNIEFSTLQRSATHIASVIDIREAYDVGIYAVNKAYEGETGKVVTINVAERDPYQVYYGLHDVHSVANEEKMVPVAWITPDHMDVTEDYCRYAKPMIAGNYMPYYVDGIPHHMTLKKK